MPTPTYRALVHCGAALAPVFARFDAKLRAGLAGRLGLLDRFARWSREGRDPARPLLWMHAASVGEGLQAEVVLRRLRKAHPDWQIAYTFFSPSAAELGCRQPADFADYLPFDRRRDVLAALQALRPNALCFSKLDLWPELASDAAAKGVAVGIIAATVSPRARRLRWPARALLRPGYAAVSAAGAVSEADAERLVRLGVLPHGVEITGDPRCDSVLERAAGAAADESPLSWARSGRILVAGSTWPEDEDRLLAAFRVVRAAVPEARLLLVPHEPTPAHLDRLDSAGRRQGFEPARLGATSRDEPLLIVAHVGSLARLYRAGYAAYVGGGYGGRGLHSVLEPAAWGIPVLFGPRWSGSPDAAALLSRRAALATEGEFPAWLDREQDNDANTGSNPLAARWLALLRQPVRARAAGQRALDYVKAGTGAAAKSAVLVERLMERGSYCGRPMTTPS